MDYDVFNGDADGIISLVQLRLSEPRDAKLITGRKRDIQLLERVSAQVGDRVTVLDRALTALGLLLRLTAIISQPWQSD